MALLTMKKINEQKRRFAKSTTICYRYTIKHQHLKQECIIANKQTNTQTNKKAKVKLASMIVLRRNSLYM
jgi:hypothetical protein